MKQKQKQNHNKIKILPIFLAVVIALTAIFTTMTAISGMEVFAKGGSKPSKANDEVSIKENIMKGLSNFKYKVYEWPDSLTVGKLSFNVAESIYTMRNKKSKKPVLWNEDELTKSMKDFYSSTDWNNFSGMYETVEIGNFCEATLSDEVAAYEELMDDAAERYGIRLYKEIFKAIAQARFNEYKTTYSEASKKGYIKGKGTDKFDLFHIDGSWIDGGATPVGKAKAPIQSPINVSEKTSSRTVTEDKEPVFASPTPMPESSPTSPFEDRYATGNFTVEESINIAAKAFSEIIESAVFPSPYDISALTGSVQSFEFGGKSNAIKSQYRKSPIKLSNYSSFISFEQYCDNESHIGDTSQSKEEDVDYDKIIAKYARTIAHGKQRSATDTYGKYKYSDQKFYQKVFENYKCSGGGSIDYGQLPEDMKEILRQCMQTWDSRVTKERREIIQQGVLLYGVTYSMDYRNSPSVESPRYLDCSSYVGQCYWRAGLMPRDTVGWCTGTFASNFQQINESQLIPGDIAQKTWNPGGSGGSEHIGIYIGTVGGTKYYIHCAGGYTNGVYHAPGKGVRIDSYSGFQYFGKKPGL